MLKSDTILALDIGASSVKMGQFVPLKSGGLELAKYSIFPLDSDPSVEENRMADIREAVRQLMEENGIHGGPVLLSVPGQSVFSRFVKLPPASREKVLQIVQYEAQQNVPFPINEVVWDYQLIGGQNNEIDVMLAAIKAEIIDKLTDTISSVGLQPDLVDVAPMAVYNAVRYNYSELPPCTLVIDIGARSTDLIFIEEGRVFNRSIPVGGNTITQQIMREFSLEFTDAEQLKKAHAFVAFGGAYEAPSSEVADKVSKTVRTVMTRLHSEITRSINFYRTQQNGTQPALALLTGGSSIINFTDTFLREKLQMDVDYLNPFLNVAVSPSIDAADIGSKAHLMAEVVGLALRRTLTCPIELNLMPDKLIKEKVFHRKQPFFIASMACALLVLGVWCTYFYKRAAQGDQTLTAIQRQVNGLQRIQNQLREQETKVADISKRIETLSALLPLRGRWQALLADIRSRIPEGMWLTRVAPHTAESLAALEAGAAAPAAAGMPMGMPIGMPGAPGAEPGAAPSTAIVALELTGHGYKDKAKSKGGMAIGFRDVLRESKWLNPEKTDVKKSPVSAAEVPTVEFTIVAQLKDPIEP